MVHSKPIKTHDFTEVLDALEAIDSLPFGKNLSDENNEPSKAGARHSSQQSNTSKKWIFHILNSITGRKTAPAQQAAQAPQAASDAYSKDAELDEDLLEDFSEQFSRLEQENIACELGLRGDLSGLDLRQIRRDFAKANHPDRCEEEFRAEASRRMTIANMLIDEARKKQKLGVPWK